MATPRWRKFHEWEPLIVHTVSRCVRRHPILETTARRGWIERRLGDLVDCFAIDVLEWAAMTNHLHLGLRTHPHLAMAWSDEEIARRWLTICPNWTVKRVLGLDDVGPSDREIEIAIQDRPLLCDWRRRLYDLGWFHKLLKEPCARLWNLEDNVSGHVWQERYFCLPCRSSDQLKATAAYIALNPVRAGAADELDRCRHSSIERRLKQLETELQRGMHQNDREAHERVMLAPALPCQRGAEVEAMSDAEFSRRVDRFMAVLTRRDHAIADAHKAKLDAERFEGPAPAEDADLVLRSKRHPQSKTMPVDSRPRHPLADSTENEATERTAGVASASMSAADGTREEGRSRDHDGDGARPLGTPAPDSHAGPSDDAPDDHVQDSTGREAWEAARVRRLLRTRAKPRPRMPHRDPNARPPRRINHWSRSDGPPALEGLTLAAFIEYVDTVGRVTPAPGKASIRSDAPRAVAKLRARVEAEWSARDGPPAR
jgi:hypothetical protein